MNFELSHEMCKCFPLSCIIFREGVERVFSFKSAKAKLVKKEEGQIERQRRRGRKFDLNFLSSTIANKSFMNMFGNNDFAALCTMFSTSSYKSEKPQILRSSSFVNEYTLLEKNIVFLCQWTQETESLCTLVSIMRTSY